jgi:hypothetical protein
VKIFNFYIPDYQWNLLIFTSYCISVSYIFYRAIKSIDNQVKIKFNQEFLDSQLDAQGLKSLISIQFKLKERYQTEHLRDLQVAIKNQSEKVSITVDWDQSSLTDFDGRSRRVIRLIPGMTLDLFQPQASSIIAVTQTLKEQITAEDTLKRNSSGGFEIAASLFKPKRFEKASEKGEQFYLRLFIKIFDATQETPALRAHILSCQFTVEKLPWTDALQPKA